MIHSDLSIVCAGAHYHQKSSRAGLLQQVRIKYLQLPHSELPPRVMLDSRRVALNHSRPWQNILAEHTASLDQLCTTTNLSPDMIRSMRVNVDFKHKNIVVNGNKYKVFAQAIHNETSNDIP